MSTIYVYVAHNICSTSCCGFMLWITSTILWGTCCEQQVVGCMLWTTFVDMCSTTWVTVTHNIHPQHVFHNTCNCHPHHTCTTCVDVVHKTCSTPCCGYVLWITSTTLWGTCCGHRPYRYVYQNKLNNS